MRLKQWIIGTVVCGLMSNASAQDIHLTQWWMNDGFVAPAQIHSAHDVLVQAGLKSQWNGVSGVPFQLQTVHINVTLPQHPQWSVQGAYLRDRSGDGSWLQSKWNLGMGWRAGGDTSKWVFRSVILMRGGGSRWDNEAWQFMDDWNGLFYQEDLGQKEFFDRTSALGWAWSSSLRGQSSGSVQWNLGFTHFSKMNYHFKYGAHAFTWSPQQVAFGKVKFASTRSHPISVFTLFQKQNKHSAWLGYGEWGTVLDSRSWLNTTWWIGGGGRWGDAFILGTACSWGGHLMRLTYDLNVSPFRVATEYRGGWEVQYQYQFLKPDLKRKMRPTCPSYY